MWYYLVWIVIPDIDAWLKKMKANTEALDQLHYSLSELIAILRKTNVGPNVSEDLKQNVARLFE